MILNLDIIKTGALQDLSQETLEEIVPNDPDNYGLKVEESRLDSYKNFFSKSYLDHG